MEPFSEALLSVRLIGGLSFLPSMPATAPVWTGTRSDQGLVLYLALAGSCELRRHGGSTEVTLDEGHLYISVNQGVRVVHQRTASAGDRVWSLADPMAAQRSRTDPVDQVVATRRILRGELSCGHEVLAILGAREPSATACDVNLFGWLRTLIAEDHEGGFGGKVLDASVAAERLAELIVIKEVRKQLCDVWADRSPDFSSGARHMH